MTLKRAAETVDRDARAIQDQGRLLHELQVLDGLSEDLGKCADKLESASKTAALLHTAEILNEMTQPPEESLRALAALVEGDQVVNNPQASARNPMSSLNAWSRDELDRCERSWRSWRDALMPDLVAVAAFLDQFVDFIESRRLIASRIRLTEAEKLKLMRLPTSQEDIEKVRSVSRDLAEATRLEGVSEEVKAFLEAALADGAPIELLDASEVRAWLRDQGHMERVRVRLDLNVESDE